MTFQTGLAQDAL